MLLLYTKPNKFSRVFEKFFGFFLRTAFYCRKTPVNYLFIAKNSRRKYFRREFCRLYNTRSGYWKKLVPVIGKTIHHQVPQNAVLIMPKTNPATANPAHRVRVFFYATPTILNASPAALSSKRKNITLVFQKTLIEQRKINKLTQKQAANTSESRNRLYPLRKRTIRAVFDQPCKISGLIRRFGRLSYRQNGFIRVL